MKSQNSNYFGPFHLDRVNECLWCGKQRIALKPKAFAVLRYLVEHPGRLITKDELLDTVWPDTVVSDGVLKFCMREIRAALGDNPQAPRFIETLHRRGYRFIAKVVSRQYPVGRRQEQSRVPSLESRVQKPHGGSTPYTRHPTPSLVGREAELAQLHNWLEKALHGERQIVFVTGEPGIGKTALVEVFLKSLVSSVQRPESKTHDDSLHDVQTLDPRHQIRDARLWIGYGQCIEHYGVGEAYLPILSALGQLCRAPGGHRLIELLTQHAPTWLAQMPALLSATEQEVLQRKVAGATRGRMLRELAEAVEVLTTERPLVLWLEDLHWSDYSTLDLVSYLAQRREHARLLVIGIYRPVEVLAREHPLQTVKQELQLHGRCEELSLGLLTEAAVEEYLAVRFRIIPSPRTGEACPEHSRRSQNGEASQQELSRWPPHPDPLPRGKREAALSILALRELAQVIHHRTEGNPLFIINLVDYLVAQGAIVQHDGQWVVRGGLKPIEVGVPQSLRQMIEKQIDRLSLEDQRLLEAASVAGVTFSAAAVATALAADVEQIEEGCEGLARRQLFLCPAGISEWPDGTLAAHYGFLHALYQNVLYEHVTAARRRRLHQRIGERQEGGYGEQAGEIAAELAAHFERSRDYGRAVKHFGQAGAKAIGRSAHREAIDLLSKGLALLERLPDTFERTGQELRLQLALGTSLRATQGYGAPEVEHVYIRARELCQQLGEPPQLFPVLWGLWYFYFVRLELQRARELGQQCLSLAYRVHDPAFLVEAHFALGLTLLLLGELTLAREHLEQGIALYDPQQHRSFTFLYGQDPKVTSLAIAAWALWYLGYPDQALKRIHEALTLAHELSHPFSLTYVLISAAFLHQYRREGQVTQEWAEAALTLSTEQGFAAWAAYGAFLRGWALTEQGQEEGIAQMRQGLAAAQATGTVLGRPSHLALLAEAYGERGQAEKGLGALAEALAVVDKTGERRYEAELYRLYGELSLRIGEPETGRTGNAENEPENRRAGEPGNRREGVSFADSPIRRFPVSSPEEAFQKAIELARQQQAKSLELRATMSLARLWQQQGKKKEAHEMLAEIYDWFTEGFETKDLQEAKALLEALKH